MTAIAPASTDKSALEGKMSEINSAAKNALSISKAPTTTPCGFPTDIKTLEAPALLEPTFFISMPSLFVFF